MRGITYAIVEISIFMMAATLVGYLLGRAKTALEWYDPSDVEREMQRQLDVANQSVADMSVELEASAERMGIVEGRNIELAEAVLVKSTVEFTSDDSGAHYLEVGDGGEDDADEKGAEEVQELIEKIEEQEEIIAKLEDVANEADGMAAVIRTRDERIADLESASPDGAEPEKVLAYSATSGGSGEFADTTIDIEILDWRHGD